VSLWINTNGKLIFNSSGNIVECNECPCVDDPPLIDGCVQCPDGVAQYWELPIAGVTNGICVVCSDLNRTFNIPWIGGCTWTTGNFLTDCGTNQRWTFFYGPKLAAETTAPIGDAWRLRYTLQGVGTLSEGQWYIHPDDFDCTGPNILTRVFTNFQRCSNFPLTVTIEPTFPP
jgi:hypothetical protein